MTDTASNGVAARHSSARVEHYTPPSIVEAARATLGTIDLDPFSCPEANTVVRAAVYSTEGGFEHDWWGHVFVNPPGGKDITGSRQKRAWFKLMSEYAARRIDAAVFVCFSLELLQTTQVKPGGPLPLDFPICYPSRRVSYWKPGGAVGSQPPHASCAILVPPIIDRIGAVYVERFRESFASIGKVVVPQ